MHSRSIPLALGFLALVLACLAWLVASNERRVVAAPLSLASEGLAASAPHDVEPGSAAVDETRGAQGSLRGAIAVESVTSETPAAERRVPRVRGRVIDATGAPVRAARVLATTSENFTEVPLDVELDALPRRGFTLAGTTTEADGRFELEALAPGPVRLVVHASGFAPHARDRAGRFDCRVDLDLGDVRLEPGLALRGRVVDPRGEPVAGASVVLALECAHRASHVRFPGRGVLVATSGSDGGFVVDELTSGPWKLCIDAPRFRIAEIRGEAFPGTSVRDDLVVRLEPGARIAGRVLAPEDALKTEMRVVARPAEIEVEDDATPSSDAADATFAATRARSERIAPDGTFVVDGLEPRARLKLVVEMRASDGTAWKRAPSADTPLVDAGASGVEIAWTRLASVRLRAIDAATGSPIEDLLAFGGQGRERVLRDDAGAITRRFEGGVVVWTDVRARANRPFRVRLRAAGRIDRVIEAVELAAGTDVDLGDVALERAAEARVRVVDAASGAPIAGAVVAAALDPALDLGDLARRLTLTDADGELQARSVQCDADGIARLALAAGTTARAVASAVGYLASEPVEVTAGMLAVEENDSTSSSRDVEAGHGAAARESNGTASVAHESDGASSVSRANGEPASASSTAVAADAGHARESTAIEGRDDALVVLALRRGGTARVTVRDEARNPVAGAFVEHELPRRGGADEREFDAPRETDARGEARFEALAAGEHRFRVRTELESVWSEDDEPEAEWTPLQVGATDAQIEVALLATARATFEGVVREGGRVLDGAQLKLVPRDRADAPGGAQWRPSGDPGSCTSAADGAFAFPPLSCGEYALFVAHPARRMVARLDVRIERGGTRHDVDLEVASIEGRITNDRREPIAGLSVRVRRVEERPFEMERPGRAVLAEDERGGADVQWRSGANEDARTDSSGRYVLRGIEAGAPIVVDVGGGAHEQKTTEPLVLGPTEVRTGVDFELRPTGWIRLELNGPRRADTTWVLRLVDGEGAVRSSTTLHGGTRRRVLSSILPGAYTLELWAPGADSATQRTSVVVEAGNVSHARLAYP